MTRRRWLQLLQASIVLLILIFWGIAVRRQWDQIAGYPWEVSWPWLLAALAVLVVQGVMLATIWWRALALTGSVIPWRLGLALWLQSQLARYLPGGIWDLAARVAMGQEEGVSKRSTTASLGLEMGLQVLSASIFLLVALALQFDAAVNAYLALGLAVAVVSTVFLSPPVFTRLVNWGLGILRRPPLDMRFSYRDLLGLFLARMLAHGLLGAGFVLFAHGVTAVPWSQTGLLLSAYVGAWLIGYLAVFVPTGIGVREGAFAMLLGGEVGFAVASVVALGYRLWIAVRDLLVAMGGRWLQGRGKAGW